MIRNRIVLKSFAIFFLLEILCSAVVPSISFALMAGPTAPEATSFEPVDTTDIVNLATGDLAYNIPLLEVPGPSGGYPLSLSYHAGIMPNEEASWVGLGWTLNPGAISRTVNGYPDDQVGAKRTRVDHFSGGERNTYMASVGLPGVGFGLDISQDSNMGMGVGAGVSVGGQIGSINAGASYGFRPYGEGSYGSASVGIGSLSVGLYADEGGVNATVGLSSNFAQGLGSVGIQSDFKSLSVSGNAALFSVGANLSSNGIRASHSVAGMSMSQSNSRAGHMQTEKWGFFVPIPLGYSGVFLNLGYNYFRYYSHESSDVNVIGSLYAPQTSGKNPDDWAFDSYALPDGLRPEDRNDEDPERARGGSFPAYDSYQVNAQGLNGSMEPYIYENGTLFRQNLKNQNDNSKYIIKYNPVNYSYNFSTRVNFRFKNDFSNSFNGTQDLMRVSGNNFSFSGQYTGFEIYNNRLPGSKHIEWFTNEDIKSGVAKGKGFIDFQKSDLRATSFNSYAIEKQVGGFSITNESGVTYHYALPAYAYDEFSKSFKQDQPDYLYQTNANKHPYVYNWYLTAITGTDYVDRNSNGMADDDDWGYWVNFEYGKWADNFKWRNPAVGFHIDLDQKTQFYSSGSKELYYLDAIKTQSHIALFAKSPRKDYKGLAINGQVPEFNFVTPRSGPADEDGNCNSSGPVAPVSTLKLDHVYLLSNSDYQKYMAENSLASISELKSKSGNVEYQYFDACANATLKKAFHNNNNVLETGDLELFAVERISARSLKGIAFELDYSLCANTLNSFAFNYTTPPAELPAQRDGKLSLKALTFLNKSGENVMPPMKFGYQKNPAYSSENYDIWGFYKSDYIVPTVTNRNKDRATSEISAQNVDAWSLTDVSLPLGSKLKITYESDTYYKATINTNYDKFIKHIYQVLDGSGNYLPKYRIDLFPASSHFEFKVGDQMWLNFAYLRETHATPNGGPFDCQFKQLPNQVFEGAANITEVTADYITIEGSELNVAMRAIKPSGNICEETTYFEFGYAFRLNKVGGGLRVTKVQLEQMNSARTTKYSYKNGITSYEPNLLDEGRNAEYNSDYYIKLLNNSYRIFCIARELPAPGVIYEQVTVEEEVTSNQQTSQIPGKKVFEFQTFNENLVEHIPSTTSENEPYVKNCYAQDGREVPCEIAPGTPADSYPSNCKDQYGNPISCILDKSPIAKITPVTINDYSAFAGVIKSVSVFGPNDVLIEKSTTNYLHDNKDMSAYRNELNASYKNQGIITHRFNEYRMRDHDFGTTHYKVFAKKVEYPLIMLGETTENYKTGVKQNSTNLEFDFFTGAPTKVLSEDGYGNSYLAESIPAYRVDPYSGMTASQVSGNFAGMGLKAKNLSNKNMLTQIAGNFVYKVDKNQPLSTKLGIVSASVQTWSDQTPVRTAPGSKQSGIWRMGSNYSWKGDDVPLNNDGYYNPSNFQAFNFMDLSSNSLQWQKNSEVTLYDVQSHALEAKDLNDRYAATVMSKDNTRVVAGAVNARYSEISILGEESPGISQQNGTLVGSKFHTGKFSYELPAGKSDQLSTLATSSEAGDYFFSTWIHESNTSNIQANYQVYKNATLIASAPVAFTPTAIKKSGEWYLFEGKIQMPTPAVVEQYTLTLSIANNSTGKVWLDDYRVHPYNAMIVTYVYNNWGELSHILNANNLYTEYQYDAMGRLSETFQERLQVGGVKTQKVIYHYTSGE
jgi:hypothetical protein